MRKILGLAVLAVVAACAAQAQVVDTTVCAVMKNPTAFDGKMVRIKGTVVTGLDSYTIDDGDCGQNVNTIWLSYPQGAKVKSGPLAMIVLQPAHNFAGTVAAGPARTPVTLTRDKTFKQFDSLLAQPHQKSGSICFGCGRYEVQATLVGRLDAVADATVRRNPAGKIVSLGGFGNLNGYPARLVLQSVSDITPKEIDYSKTDALLPKKGGDTDQSEMQGLPGRQGAPTGVAQGFPTDPMDTAEKLVKMLTPSPVTTQIEKDMTLLPKGKEQDGVSIGYGSMNEVSPAAETAGAKDSSDGVLYNCTFNRDRLPDPALTMAVLHMGQHVADIRTPPAGNDGAPLYILESNAWAVSATMALAAGERYLVLPGGYLMWDSTWPASDRVSNMMSALNDFLTKEELLTK